MKMATDSFIYNMEVADRHTAEIREEFYKIVNEEYRWVIR